MIKNPKTPKDVLNSVEAVVFDIDGTLLNSMDVWLQVDYDFLVAKGFDVPSNYGYEISIRSAQEGAVYTKELFNLKETPKEIIDTWKSMAKDAYENVEMKPFAKEFLLNLKQNGKKLAVATALTHELLTNALKKHEIYEIFDEICSTDEVGKGKTSPDVYNLAFKKLNVSPNNSAVFEDVLVAVKSAKQTGAYVFAIKDNFSLPYAKEIKKYADFYIENYSDLLCK